MRLVKAKRPAFHPSRNNPVNWTRWENISTYVIFTNFAHPKSRELSPILIDVINSFRPKGAIFLVRMCDSSDEILNRAVGILKKNKVPYKIFPQKKIGVFKVLLGELMFYSSKETDILEVFKWWAGSMYFDVMIIPERYFQDVLRSLLADAQRYTYDILYDIVHRTHCVLRKSGDEDEIEILSIHISFNEVSEIVGGLGARYNIPVKVQS